MNQEERRKILEEAGQARGVPYDILDRVAKQESGYNPRAVSPAGAQGMFQIMPATQKELGVTDPFDPRQSAQGGAAYLRKMYDQFHDWKLATAAYNAGPGAVKKYGGVPPYAETQKYQKKIWGNDMATNPGLSIDPSLAIQGAGNAAAMAGVPTVSPTGGSTSKRSKIDTALSAGTGMLAAVAELLGREKRPYEFNPVSSAGHGAAPITGGQSYNAGALQKQYGMQVSPYQSAIFSLLRGG